MKALSSGETGRTSSQLGPQLSPGKEKGVEQTDVAGEMQPMMVAPAHSHAT